MKIVLAIFCPFSDNLYRALFNEQKNPTSRGV